MVVTTSRTGHLYGGCLISVVYYPLLINHCRAWQEILLNPKAKLTIVAYRRQLKYALYIFMNSSLLLEMDRNFAQKARLKSLLGPLELPPQKGLSLSSPIDAYLYDAFLGRPNNCDMPNRQSATQKGLNPCLATLPSSAQSELIGITFRC